MGDEQRAAGAGAPFEDAVEPRPRRLGRGARDRGEARAELGGATFECRGLGGLRRVLRLEPAALGVRAFDAQLGVTQRVARELCGARRRELHVVAAALLRLGERGLRLRERAGRTLARLVRRVLLVAARRERVRIRREERRDRRRMDARLLDLGAQLVELAQRGRRVVVAALELLGDPEQRLHGADPTGARRSTRRRAAGSSRADRRGTGRRTGCRATRRSCCSSRSS